MYGDGAFIRILQDVLISAGDLFAPIPLIFIKNTFPGDE
jgi:hypothetical protein